MKKYPPTAARPNAPPAMRRVDLVFSQGGSNR